MRRIVTVVAYLIMVATSCVVNGGEGYCRPYYKLARQHSRADETGKLKGLRKSKNTEPTVAAPWTIHDLCAAYKIP